MTKVRKKLIEVLIPLEAINVASAREKIHPARASVNAASVVGATAFGGLPGGSVRPTCR